MSLRALLLASALLVGACGSYDPATMPTRSTTGREFATRPADLPMDNVGKVAEGLWRGGAPDSAGLRALKEQGFKTVVNLRSGNSYREEAEALGLRVVEIPMTAHMSCEPPTEAQVREFMEVVTDPANHPVYFHCKAGKDRTGTMCALYRMEACGWTCDEAVEEMQAFGYHDWYVDFLDFVRGYEICGEFAAASDPAAPAPPASVTD